MPNNITVKSGDTLTKIVKREYGLSNNTDIMNTVNLIKEKNKLKNVNIIQVGQQLELPEQLRLNNVTIFGEEEPVVLKPDSSSTKNYYRAEKKDEEGKLRPILGDIATKPDQYKDQEYSESMIRKITMKTTDFVEDVVVNIRGFFTNETSRDAKMADIFAKEVGTWTKDGKTASGGFALEKTDAYRFALSMNSDDYTVRETEYKGKKEEHAYFDNTKSDNNITLFGFEEIDGKEYLTMRDNEGKVHYFDKSDNLSEVPM